MTQPPPYAVGRFRTGSAPDFCGVVVDDAVVRLDALLASVATLSDLLAEWPTQAVALDAAVASFKENGSWTATAVDVASLEVLAPYRPGQIFQSGANYKKHVVDLMVAMEAQKGSTDLDEVRRTSTELMQHRADTGTPYVFIGLASSICGPYDDVILPATGTEHDWELELAVVIGSRAYQVNRDTAMEHVAGYMIANDLTTRDRIFRPDMPALGTDWLAGKNAPTFLPLGPWFVPRQFVPDPMDLRITLTLNGATMQNEATADMIFDVPRLIEHISSITPLEPGDLVLTGSPAGNGAHFGRYLQPGDVMESTITGLGRQRNLCVRP